ncbi:hypothetical protein ACFVVA_40150 [Kitasatospora sp. NPDC058048]|uniref:hypothetical protein n=1 Tax=Kitasatospora sp. NPDC058048 TaxID=3346313 RepID=UPI0036DF515B
MSQPDAAQAAALDALNAERLRAAQEAMAAAERARQEADQLREARQATPQPPVVPQPGGQS